MNTKTVGLFVVALLVVLGVGIFSFSEKGETQKKKSSPIAEEVKEIQSSYKDGVYTQNGAYKSPAGPEEIEVKLTLTKSIVTDVEVTPKATHPISKAKQEGFVKEYKGEVIGKNIKDLQLGKIAGASLTPKGFNDALAKIKAQAKS